MVWAYIPEIDETLKCDLRNLCNKVYECSLKMKSYWDLMKELDMEVDLDEKTMKRVPFNVRIEVHLDYNGSITYFVM